MIEGSGYISLTSDPDPGGQKARGSGGSGSGIGSGSGTLKKPQAGDGPPLTSSEAGKKI